MMTKQTKFILAITLQVIIVLAIAIFKLVVLTGGTEIRLRIMPVDPRDMLRGDYVTFRYDISTLDSYLFSGTRGKIVYGDIVYVILHQNGKYWSAQNVQKDKPLKDEVFIKGVVDRVDSDSMQVTYGAEEYFIPEGKGNGFSFANKIATASVVLDQEGNPVLKQLYIDDKPWP